MRILIFGDGLWAANSLEALREAGHDIAAVVVRYKPSDSRLEDEAQRLAIPVLRPRNASAPNFVHAIARKDADLGVSISFNQILRRPILESTRLGFLNFHAGKLPHYRGRNVINWAIINGEAEIGLTAHFMDEGIDTGDIILQQTLPIEWNDDYGDVLRRIVEHVPALVVEAVQGIESGELTPQPQSHLPGTYFPGREEGDEWLDWADTSLNIYNKVRAISHPGPGARTLLGDKVVIVWKAAYDSEWPKYIAIPGQVVGRSAAGSLVKTGDSVVLVQEVELESGECGRPTWAIGARLGVNFMDLVHTLQSRIRKLEAQLPLLEETYEASCSR